MNKEGLEKRLILYLDFGAGPRGGGGSNHTRRTNNRRGITYRTMDL